MLLTEFLNHDDLHYVPVARIKKMEFDNSLPRHTVIRHIDEASLSTDVRDQLNDLIDTGAGDINKILAMFETREYRPFCTSNGKDVSPRSLRNRKVRERNADMKANPVGKDAPLELKPLQNKHWKCLFLHAASIVLGYWTSAQARTLIAIRGKPFFVPVLKGKNLLL